MPIGHDLIAREQHSEEIHAPAVEAQILEESAGRDDEKGKENIPNDVPKIDVNFRTHSFQSAITSLLPCMEMGLTIFIYREVKFHFDTDLTL